MGFFKRDDDKTRRMRQEWAIEKLVAERARQHAKWGQQEPDNDLRIAAYKWVSILGEENGETARAANQWGDDNDDHGTVADFIKETVQTGAVALQILEWAHRHGLHEEDPYDE